MAEPSCWRKFDCYVRVDSERSPKRGGAIERRSEVATYSTILSVIWGTLAWRAYAVSNATARTSLIEFRLLPEFPASAANFVHHVNANAIQDLSDSVRESEIPLVSSFVAKLQELVNQI